MPTKAVKTAENRLNALMEAGSHFGHQTRRWNPKMQTYLHGAKNNIHIIDLIQTDKLLETAKTYVQDLVAAGGTILFVGTKRQARPIVQEAAESANMPYVTERWLGGMLTNFSTISDRVKHLKKLESQKEAGELTHLTKKENLIVDDQINQLRHTLGGIYSMHKLPDALVIVDIVREHTAVAEARKLNIPIVAMVDSNADPDLVTHVIPANDDAIKSIKYIIGELAQSVITGKALYDAKAKSEVKSEDEDDN